MADRLINAYRQAPWRTQFQWIGIVLLGMVVVVIITGIYLNITAQAAAAGLDVQNLEYIREQTLRDIANQRSDLAHLTSDTVMYQRALEKGYQRANMQNAIYIVIPGYVGRQFQSLTPVASTQDDSMLLPAYQQSIWDWLFTNRYYSNRPLGN